MYFSAIKHENGPSQGGSQSGYAEAHPQSRIRPKSMFFTGGGADRTEDSEVSKHLQIRIRPKSWASNDVNFPPYNPPTHGAPSSTNNESDIWWNSIPSRQSYARSTPK